MNKNAHYFLELRDRAHIVAENWDEYIVSHAEFLFLDGDAPLEMLEEASRLSDGLAQFYQDVAKWEAE